ncbi:hypothetical protein C1H46_034155 [Malus baccata]|uniref:Uncharacterized protein n=1 Tax=Malus baccata TaxID=106549 RepID=A0A540L195_MALBA|nr:hypothetical protein C1H46_034155 [Malus baccata]
MMQKKDEYLANLFQLHPDEPIKELKLDPDVSLRLLMEQVGQRKGRDGVGAPKRIIALVLHCRIPVLIINFWH